MFVSGNATILHADLDAFFASVHQRDDERLRGRPIVVGGGVVLAASYEARAYGVRSAMGGAQARRLCPDLIAVEPRFSAYVAASKAVFEIFERTSPQVQALSIDEAFLEVLGLERISGSPREIAVRLRREVRQHVGLPITVGVARTKSLAKVASNEAKPDGLLVVAPEAERAFLRPLPVERLWGVGPATAKRLHDGGIATVGELARLSELALISILGRAAGRHLHALAHNHDPRPVRSGGRRRSIGSQSAFGRSRRTAAELDAMLIGLVDRVTRRMRRARRIGRTVVLRLRFGDFARATRSQTLPRPTASSETVLATVRGLLAAARPTIERRGITLLGVTVSNLADDRPIQLPLPIESTRSDAVDALLDDVRERFGPDALTRATLLRHRPRVQAWLHPGDDDRETEAMEAAAEKRSRRQPPARPDAGADERVRGVAADH